MLLKQEGKEGTNLKEPDFNGLINTERAWKNLVALIDSNLDFSDNEDKADEEEKEEVESSVEHCKREVDRRKNLLYVTLSFYSVPEAVINKVVDNFCWLEDFFGLFLMACSRIGKQMMCLLLTEDELKKLNELFFKEYDCNPLPVPPFSTRKKGVQ